MLSSNCVDALVGCTRWDGDAQKKAAAREAVAMAAEELGFDPKAPLPPDFAGGESVLAAACRALKLKPAEKAVEEYRVRRDAVEQTMGRLESLRQRRDGLLAAEDARVSDQVTAGRVPGPSPQKARDELAAIQLELALAPDPSSLEHAVPYQTDDAVRGQAISREEWLAVTLYLHLLRDRLLVATEGEGTRSRARMQAEAAAWPATSYEKEANTRMGLDADAQAQYVEVRRTRQAVEAADLHDRRARERRRQEQERTIEELETAMASRA